MTFIASNVEILILFKNNENKRNKANYISSIVKIDYQIYPLGYFSVSVKIFFGPPFEIFCTVLALTKVGSAGLDPSESLLNSSQFTLILYVFYLITINNYK
jgi:hypothetical protein